MAVPGRQMTPMLSSTILLGSEEDIKLFCQPCDRNGPRLHAFGYCVNCKEYLCQRCYIDHKKSAPHRKHNLLDKDAMPISKSPLKTGNIGTDTSEELTTPCSKHKENFLKFYCYHHKSLICSKCKNLDHINTECSVVYIPDVSDAILNGKEFCDTISNLEDIVKQSEKMKLECGVLAKESNSSLDDALNAMRSFRAEMNKRIDELETAYLNEVKTASQNNYMEVRKIETTCNSVTKSSKSLLESLKELNKTKNGKKLFMELKSARQEMHNNATLLATLERSKNKKEYEFKPNETVASILKQEKSLGKLVQKSESSACPSEIFVKTSEDRNKCWVTGMTLLDPDKLVLTDSVNKSVKMVDVISKMVTAQISVDGAPFDVTKVSDDEVAVTLPGEGKIDFISVVPNELSLKRSLKADGTSCGISFDAGKGFVVSFDNPAKLDILDIKGNLRSTIRKNAKGEDIFSGPDYVKAYKDFIFVSDRGKKSVIRLNWKGEVTGVCSGKLMSPQGLTLSVDGTVFVCDNSSNSLHEISPDFRTGTILIPDINRPCAVCFCDTTGNLYISRYTRNKSFDNYIQIYQRT